MELPIVSTTVGAEGLPVIHGEHLLVADEAGRFADAVIQVATQDTLARQLASRASKLVRERYGWSHAAARFVEICETAVQQRKICADHSRVSNALPVPGLVETVCE